MNGGMTILLVDDEQTQRNILAGYLRKKGYTVLEAGTAEEGIDLVRSTPVEIVLSDSLPARSLKSIDDSFGLPGNLCRCESIPLTWVGACRLPRKNMSGRQASLPRLSSRDDLALRHFVSSITGNPSFPDPMIMTFVFGEFASFSVASTPFHRSS